MEPEPGSLDALVQEKLDADTDFQSSLASLSDDEREAAITSKKSEILQSEAVSLLDKANKASKAEELANNYKTRAEKAETELKKLKGESAPAAQHPDVLSPKESYALQDAKVHVEDFDDVVKSAKFFGDGDVTKGLKHPSVQALMEHKDTLRRSAEAANTRNTRPSNKAPTDEQIVKDAAEGKIPEPGSSEAERLFWARRGGKKK